MVRSLCFVVAAVVGLSASVCSADDLAAEILKYFPGKWSMKAADGTELGTVDWKLVSGGKAIAGPSVFTSGVTSFGLAGWDAKAKMWIHHSFATDGVYARMEVSKLEGDTYTGTTHFVDADGQTGTTPWKTRIVDQDHYEHTAIVNGEEVVVHAHRMKE